MAERCGFFNATNSSDPDRVYDSSDFAAYFASFIGNGVFAKHSDQLRVAQQDSPDMSVQVLGGQAWINGWWYENTSTLNINIDPADGTLDRIDIIVVQFDLTNRVIKTIVRKGSPSAGATAPALNRDDDLWELKLAEVNVPHGTVNITDGKITDTRSDTTVCGWVSGLIDQMDTTELFNQLKEATQDAVDAMNDAIDGTIAGNLQTYRRSLRVETEIPAEADLNEYQTAGNYGCSVADNVAGIKNKPSGLANQFLLFVHTVGSAVLQEVIDVVDGSRWCRAGAGAWVQTYDSSSIVPVANGGTGATSASAARENLQLQLSALYNSSPWFVYTNGRFVWVLVVGAKTGSGSWDMVTCPYTLASSYRPARDITVPCITENGASWTGVISVKTNGQIQVGNFGASGSNDSRYGVVVFPMDY